MVNELTEKLIQRTRVFAKDCIKLLSENASKSRLFWHIESQLIRSATSTAANYRAACLAQSKAAFVAKLSIVIEEVDESVFWLELLNEECLISEEKIKPIILEGRELTKIFIASRKSMNNRNYQ